MNSGRSTSHQNFNKTAHVIDVFDAYYGKKKLHGNLDNPLDSLVQTVLSQNTNDNNSHRAWISLRKKFPSWRSIDNAKSTSIAKAIEVGGLKNQKALTIKRILRSLKVKTGRYSLDFLRYYEDAAMDSYLQGFKGVGPKTAACVMIFAFGRPIFPVDTHIHRICNRLGLVKTRSAGETQIRMKSLVPSQNSYSFHLNLIRFGREICHAQLPTCDSCPIFDLCIFTKKQMMLSGKKTTIQRISS